MNSEKKILTPSRRDAIRTLGAVALAGVPLVNHIPAWGQAACAVLGSPSLTEGPYFVDEDLNRSDIRFDPADGSMQPGVPLSLAINVSQLVNCRTTPLTGAYVDLWHCGAGGVYSDIAAQNSVGRKYLRGIQSTNRQGRVYFMTVYPGWYQGRAVHMHAKVRVFNGLDQTYEFTSQFFFDETFTDEVFKQAPYAARGVRDTRNSNDGIYGGPSATGTAITSNSGANLLLALRNRSGWVEADAKLICDLSLGSSPSQVPGGGGGAPGGGGGGMPPGGMPPGGGGMPPPGA
jgi:protocatechuate 3,4-dioxygenase beta subunit